MTQKTRVSRVVSNSCYSGSNIMTVLMQFDYGVHLPQRAWQLDMLAPGITSPKCVRVYMSIARPHLIESRPQFSDIQTHIKCEPTDVRKYLSRRCHCKALPAIYGQNGWYLTWCIRTPTLLTSSMLGSVEIPTILSRPRTRGWRWGGPRRVDG